MRLKDDLLYAAFEELLVKKEAAEECVQIAMDKSLAAQKRLDKARQQADIFTKLDAAAKEEYILKSHELSETQKQLDEVLQKIKERSEKEDNKHGKGDQQPEPGKTVFDKENNGKHMGWVIRNCTGFVHESKVSFEKEKKTAYCANFDNQQDNKGINSYNTGIEFKHKAPRCSATDKTNGFNVEQRCQNNTENNLIDDKSLRKDHVHNSNQRYDLVERSNTAIDFKFHESVQQSIAKYDIESSVSSDFDFKSFPRKKTLFPQSNVSNDIPALDLFQPKSFPELPKIDDAMILRTIFMTPQKIMEFMDLQAIKSSSILSSSSVKNILEIKYSNRRLELLGDAVLATAVSYVLMVRYPFATVSELDSYRMQFLSNLYFSHLSKSAYQLYKYIPNFHGSEETKNCTFQIAKNGKCVHSNLFEAYIGGLYISIRKRSSWTEAWTKITAFVEKLIDKEEHENQTNGLRKYNRTFYKRLALTDQDYETAMVNYKREAEKEISLLTEVPKTVTENEYVASQMVQTNFVNSASQHILKRYSIDDSFRYNVDRLLATFSTDRLLYFGNPLYRFYLIDEYCLVRPWLAVGEIQKLYVRPENNKPLEHALRKIKRFSVATKSPAACLKVYLSAIFLAGLVPYRDPTRMFRNQVSFSKGLDSCSYNTAKIFLFRKVMPKFRANIEQTVMPGKQINIKRFKTMNDKFVSILKQKYSLPVIE